MKTLNSSPKSLSGQNPTLFDYFKVAGVFLLSSIIVSLILQPSAQKFSSFKFKVNFPAPRDFISDFNGSVIDREETELKIERAKAQSTAFYRLNYKPNRKAAYQLEKLLKSGDEEIKKFFEKKENKNLNLKKPDELRNILRFAIFVLKRSRRYYLADIIEKDYGKYTLIHEGGLKTTISPSKVYNINNFLKIMFTQNRWRFKIAPEQEGKVLSLLSSILNPNMYFDRNLTQKELEKRIGTNIPVSYPVKKGEVIVRKGDIVDRVDLLKIKEITSRNKKYKGITKLFMSILFLALFLFLTFMVITKFYKNNKNHCLKDSIYIGTLIILQAILLWLFTRLSVVIAPSPFANQTELIILITPFVYSLLISTSLIRKEHLTVLLSLTLPVIPLLYRVKMAELFTLYWAVCGIFLLLIRRDVEKSFDIFKYSVIIGIFSLAVASILYRYLYVSEFWLQAGFYSLVSSILSGILAIGLLPALEYIFGFSSNVNLLELASLNHPLLKELAVKAPGTYNHSIMVGTLAEAAAENIDANPILVRVGAYFHDIGKMKKSAYYVENQKGDINPHSRYTPSMSALIITSHIKEGVEMAKKHKLPEEIIDIIREHQGTSLITYFYEKAKERAEDPSDVNENDFRYPGPKPQTRESAIIMLADSIEAAARTLKNPTSDQIAGMVQKLINRIFADGQLEESPITLKDLHGIASAFIRVLVGIYHKRIDYPKSVAKGKSQEETGDEKKGQKQNNSEPQEEDVEEIKRLGTPRY